MDHSYSIYRLQRSLHKQQARDIRSYLLSIREDSEFVLDVASAYGLPVLGNLRNGLWYVPPSFLSGKCYFKSTDGHDGQWTISTTRLNLNVAETAADCNGCIVVDSTRSGKLFPDALSATVPIWCAVINRIVFPSQPPAFHAPHWMVASSKAIIDARIDEWVQTIPAPTRTMIQEHLTQKLTKPMLPVWVCPSSFDHEHIPALPDEFTPIVLVSASKVLSSEAAREMHSWVYVQGAGDDEENWAMGLTPQLFWDNAEAILSSDDTADVQAMVKQVVQSSKLGGTSGEQEQEGHPQHWWLGSTGLCVASPQSELVRTLNQNHQVTGVCTLLPEPLFDTRQEEKDGDPAAAAVPRLPRPSLCCELALRSEKRAHPREYWVETLIPKVVQFYEECRTKHQRDEQPGSPKLVIVCATGSEASVIMATALLCKYFRENGTSMEPRESNDSPIVHSKSTIRQRLLFIQFHHPMAQPPRRLLKELNNYLLGPGSSGANDDARS